MGERRVGQLSKNLFLFAHSSRSHAAECLIVSLLDGFGLCSRAGKFKFNKRSLHFSPQIFMHCCFKATHYARFCEPLIPHPPSPDTCRYHEKNTIMFDDLRRNFVMNPQNGLKIRPFRKAHLNRDSDTELLELSKYLLAIAPLDDMSSLHHSKWEEYE